MVQEVDVTHSRTHHFTVCLKCLRAFSKARDIFPESVSISKVIEIVKDPASPVLIAINGGSSAVSRDLQKA